MACSLRLAVSGSMLVSGLPKVWSLQLLAIDPDPGAEALPVITHDLELSCDGQQLARVSVAYFYCVFFSQVAPYIVLESCG